MSTSNNNIKDPQESSLGHLLVVSWHSTIPEYTGSNVRIRNILLNFREIQPLLLAPDPKDKQLLHLPFRPFTVPQFLNKMVPINLQILGCIGASVKRQALDLLGDRKVECVQCEHLWTFPLAHKLSQALQVPLILIEHNIETIYSQRTYSSQLLAKLTHRYEHKALKASDRIVVCSELDRDCLMEKFGLPEEKIWIVPNGITLPEDADNANGTNFLDDLNDYKIALFLGKTSYSPNTKAISIIEHSILPKLRSKNQKILIVVVGGPKEKDFSRLDEGIIYTGFVPSIQPYLNRADVCIAPLISGSGTRLKILEYAAYRKPIVATPVSAEGLGMLDEQEIFIRDDWDDFADAILSLTNNPDKSKEMGAAAYKKIKDKYQWQGIAENYEHQLLTLLESRKECNE